MRRICLCMMMVFLAALCLNGTASAELVLVSQGEILDEGPCGENLTWTLYSDGTLVISGTGPSYDFVKGIL